MADGRLIFDTKIDNTGFQKGMGQLKNIAGKAASIVKTSMKVAATAITAIGVASIKVGSDFEAAMSRVGAISGATGKEFKALEKTAMELGKTTVFSASEAAEGMQYLAMAGYKTNEIIAAMPGVLNAAAAGQVELGTAADITSNVLAGFGLEAKETSRVADVLTKAFTSSNTSMESLGETMKYVAPVARAAGFSLEETAAAAGILGDAGIQGSQAGTTLRAVMLRLVNPPKQAAEALDMLGVSVTDSTGKMKPLYQIIAELEEATRDMDDAQRTAIISQIAGQQAASGLLAIMDAGPEKIKAFTEELENAGGTAEEIANKQLDNLQGDLKLLGSVLETLGIKIYKGFNEPLRGAVQVLTDYIEQLADAIDGQQGFSAMAETIGDVLADMASKAANTAPKMLEAAISIMVSFIRGIQGNKNQLIQATLDILQSFIQTFLVIVPEMIMLGIEMLTGFIQGLVQKMPALIGQAQHIILNMVSAIVENLPLILEAGIQIITMLALGIAEMIPELITQFIELIVMLSDVIIENLPIMIEAGLQIILAIAQGLIENLPVLIEQAPRIINSFFDAIIANLPQIVLAGIQIIGMLIVGIIKSIPTLIANIPAIVRAIVNVITLYNWAQLGKTIMVWLKDGIMTMPGQIAQAGNQIAQAGWNAIKEIFQEAPRLGSGFIRWLIEGIMSMLESLVSSASSIASSAWDAVLGIFKNAPSLGSNFVGWLRNGISSNTGRLTSEVRSLGRTAVRTIENVFSVMPSIGEQFVRGLWSGIASMTGWIGKQIANFANSLVNQFKRFFKIGSPSKLMEEEIGKNLVLGVGVGIEDELPNLNSQFKKLVEGIKFESAAIGLEASISTQTSRSSVVQYNDKGITQHITIVNPKGTPSENARHLKKVGRELLLGY